MRTMSLLPTLEPADEWLETLLRETFALHMSPDEYAAREARRTLLFSFGR